MIPRVTMILAALCVGSAPALAQSSPPADTELRKQRFLADILDPNGAQSRTVERDRQRCAGGAAPTNDRASRAGGVYFLPDSSDTCIATLTRTARDGKLDLLYRQGLRELTGKEDGFDHLPAAIGATARKNETVVPLGEGRGMTLKPALAFDAGFTVGYRQGFGSTPPAIADERLKAIAEGCLDQQGGLNNCFVAGRVYGHRVAGAKLTAR